MNIGIKNDLFCILNMKYIKKCNLLYNYNIILLKYRKN